MMVSPGHTPTNLQSHLYVSFLHGHTTDVQVHVKGRWEALYHLHRVVLIQAGFFRSLFTAGFLESKHGIYFTGAPDEVTIRFDDTNITRPAFEICVARLYGGGPELFLSPSVIPTTASPLTTSFQSPRQQSATPPGQHPATPRFLLSLLATSIYLSIPSITSQALSLVLSSVGPHTVHRYLNFAIGYGIGPPEDDELLSAVGLENVGKDVTHSPEDTSSAVMSATKRDEFGDCKLFSSNFAESEKEDSSSQLIEPCFNYGRIGDKVGEVSACWLTRWGADILPYEEAAADDRLVPDRPQQPEVGPSRHFSTAIISSNDFFINDEWKRYDFARRVIDLRRREGIDPEEEKEWRILFQRGIHYTHMLFEDLVRISQDVSPITGQTYVPIEVIHAAHWTQSLLRHSIITRSPVSNNSSPPYYRDKELGITLSTAEILAITSSDHASDSERTKPYYPVPFVDTSQRLGDTDNALASASNSTEQLLGREQDLPGPGHTPTDQAHFFGILSQQYTAASCIQMDTTGKTLWSPYPPVRFAVEFWGISTLLEKSRLHSRTIWYAGSLFNVYVLFVRKKGVQLGVYLHRQSSVDPLPRASAPPVTTRADHALGNNTEGLSSRPQTPARGHVRLPSWTTTAAAAVPGSPSLTPSSPTQFPPGQTAPVQPYRDPRAVVFAHFTISCASATGSSLTRFSSKPDQFAISQSWGWKSSTLRTEEFVDVNGEERVPVSREASLRATVVLGLI